MKRDKLSLDLFWIKDESVEDSTLPDPYVPAHEIVNDLEDAIEQLTAIPGAMKSPHRAGRQNG